MYTSMDLKIGIYSDVNTPYERIFRNWSQLGHSTLRLKYLLADMESNIRQLRDLKTMYRFQHLVQSYYIGIFEARERLFSCTAALTKNDKFKDKLRNPRKRVTAYKVLSGICKDCVPHLKNILELIEDDIDLRNTQTHDTFLRVALYNKNNIFDIEDLWWEHEGESDFMKNLFSYIRKEANILISDYMVKVSLLDNEIDSLIKSLIPYLRDVND